MIETLACVLIENYKNVTRYNVDVKVSAFDLASTYLVAWENLIRDAGALGVMCYNGVNGLPTCANPSLNRTLRELWNFKGYITSIPIRANVFCGHPQGIDHLKPLPTNGTDATAFMLQLVVPTSTLEIHITTSCKWSGIVRFQMNSLVLL